MRKYVLVFALLFTLAACGTKTNSESGKPFRSGESLPPPEAEVQKGDFVYRLFTEKDVYDIFDGTAIFAELTYVGNQASIDIYHAASPFYFPLEERTRGIDVDYAMDEPLITTTLTKNEPFQERYSFAGGYSDNDDEKYVSFVKTLMNEGFPEGEYLIHGSAEFYTKDPAGAIDKETYKMNADIGFTVTKGVNE